MSKTIEIMIPVTIPDGWEFVEWRAARCDEWVVDDEGRAGRWHHICDSDHCYPIIRKIKPTPWKPENGERVWWLLSKGIWANENYCSWHEREYDHGSIYPESTTEDERDAISAAVKAVHLEFHAKRDGVAR